MRGAVPTSLVAAEDVLSGHPDRLCDAVAEAIVEVACAHDAEALVGVEVALHRHLLVITGRVAAGSPTDPLSLDISSLARDMLAGAGYTGPWEHAVDVVTDLDVGPLGDDERSIRRFSDDQGIAVGHCDPDGLDGLPVEAAVARRLRHALADARAAAPDALGPDGKVLAVLRIGGDRPAVERVNVAVQHRDGIGYDTLHRLVVPFVEGVLQELVTRLGIPSSLDGRTLRLNGIGDFTCGGPHGDNGLSGKKLVVDHYGPQVPIGGGAMCGKDPHKPDRVGPLRARQLAVRLAAATQQAATVHVGWLPGLEGPDRLAARLAGGQKLDRDDIESLVAVPDLSLAGSARDLELASVRWTNAITRGYVGANWPWDN
jgi:S-adenosylmethionine synthetase